MHKHRPQQPLPPSTQIHLSPDMPEPVDHTQEIKDLTAALTKALGQLSNTIASKKTETVVNAPAGGGNTVDMREVINSLKRLETCIDNNTAAIEALEDAYRTTKVLTEENGTLRLTVGG